VSDATGSDRPTNRLAQETSPYLLQHQHNPVDWYPWGDEALARAKQEQKPILLSVGYSACHWCHVMERESFEDARIAALMNEHFVCVKLDREERPDLDAIYMQATLALRGHGGWPMNVFLTPDLEPFFAGTYFPPQDRHGLPSWETVLLALAQAWRDKRDDVVKDANRIAAHLKEVAGATAPQALGVDLLAKACEQLAEEYDPEHGGFGDAPKFPRPEALSLLLRHHRRSGDAKALEMVRGTLDGMARGGIYDQLGGGFARYSTDAEWLVPHFEKMLYDNALLARAYLEGFQVTGEKRYRRVAVETLDYVLREMTSAEGGFFAATDADSEGVEGKFFVWTPEQVHEVLGDEAGARFCAYYDVREGGNWEGASILNTPRSLDEVAGELRLEAGVLERELIAARVKLYAARSERVPPGLDDKILTAWNGLMISALALGYRVLADERYLVGARNAADLLLTRCVDEDGKLKRSYKAGRARFDATLEDYAYLAAGLVDLYEASGRHSYLAAATVLVERVLGDFSDEAGGALYFTAKDAEQLLLRHREGQDGATPNPNAVAALTFARLSWLLDFPDLRQAARAAVEAYGGAVAKVPRAFASSLAVVDLLDAGPVELALAGKPGEGGWDALWAELGRRYLPNAILGRTSGDPPGLEDPDPLPVLAGKALVGGQAALFVCKDFTCRAPITDPAHVAAALDPAGPA
jgi:uncharacterized protein YyaL (SSP411 family)